jgi:DNA-binding CsgD family transcriptional regulator
MNRTDSPFFKDAEMHWNEVVGLAAAGPSKRTNRTALNLADAKPLIERFSMCASASEVGNLFAEAIRPAGYFKVSCGISVDAPEGKTWQFYFNSWPAEWLTEYRNNGYVRYDLAPLMSRFFSRPFTWLEVLRARNLTEQQAAYVNKVRETGAADGFAVPIHQPGNDIGLCVSVSDHPISDLEEQLFLQVVSLHAFARCQTLGVASDANSVKAPLSVREIDCLRWVLKGKSDTDIGKILEISPTTVHFHVERGKKKLGVRTRTQAAAMIMTLGYL